MTKIGIVDDKEHTFNILSKLNKNNFQISNVLNYNDKYNILIITKHLNDFDASKLLEDKGFVLLNSDIPKPRLFFKRAQVITFGYSSKACVTVSSISNNFRDMQFCVQRTFCNADGQKIYPYEFPFSLTNALNENENIYPYMAAVTAAIVGGAIVS